MTNKLFLGIILSDTLFDATALAWKKIISFQRHDE